MLAIRDELKLILLIFLIWRFGLILGSFGSKQYQNKFEESGFMDFVQGQCITLEQNKKYSDVMKRDASVQRLVLKKILPAVPQKKTSKTKRPSLEQLSMITVQ